MAVGKEDADGEAKPSCATALPPNLVARAPLVKECVRVGAGNRIAPKRASMKRESVALIPDV
jgi:hypothetical protein